MRLVILLFSLVLGGLSACAVETGPPVRPEEVQRTQAEIWEIKLREYLACEERVGNLLVRILPETEKQKPYPWFLAKGIDLTQTPPEIDQALSKIFRKPLPPKGLLITFVHPYYRSQGLSRGTIVTRVLSSKITLDTPIRLVLRGNRVLKIKPLTIYTRPVDFKILNRPEPNAWVTPEYRMYVTTALCRTLPDDHELAAVIGHELAHLQRGHLRKQMLFLTLRDLIGLGVYNLGGGIAEDLYRLGTNFALLKFSRDQEREADFYGLWYIYRAGFDLKRASQVWIHLAAVLPPGPPSILSSHPSTAERLARIRKIVKAIESGKNFEDLRREPP